MKLADILQAKDSRIIFLEEELTNCKIEIKRLKEQATPTAVVKSLLSDDDIYLKASEYARNVQYPLNSTNAKLRQAFKNGAMLIKNNLKQNQ